MDIQKHRKGQQSDNHHFLTVCGKQQLVAEPHSLGDVIANTDDPTPCGIFHPDAEAGKKPSSGPFVGEPKHLWAYIFINLQKDSLPHS